MGNSGTAMRLLLGLLAGQNFDSRLVGDSSLSSRPMRRVIDPLQSMGALIDSEQGGRAPLQVHASRGLRAIHYDMPVASAQVKSCLMLAGLYADGETIVREPAPISSAAFFMVAASIAPGSDITLQHVGINPTRTGVIDILRLMGGDIELLNQREIGGEPVADIRVGYADLNGIDIPLELVPLAIDEFPVLFVAAACAHGTTRLSGAEELRVKESDRIQVMADGLAELGIANQVEDDGIIVEGGQLGGGTVDAHGDHRIAMAFSVASLRASRDIRIKDSDNVKTSFPEFTELAREAGIRIDIDEE
jgi:3-phosphoshikimate 1-carboxyvinyltransferase